MDQEKAFQDYYTEEFNHCYGCGQLNSRGLRIRTFWEGNETVTRFVPQPYHTAIPGYVYGGLIASLIDCHGTGSAAAAAYKAENRTMDSLPAHRFVTASLKVDYLRPTPLGPELEIRGRIAQVKGRKVIVDIDLLAEGKVCARGQVTAVELPENWGRNPAD